MNVSTEKEHLLSLIPSRFQIHSVICVFVDFSSILRTHPHTRLPAKSMISSYSPFCRVAQYYTKALFHRIHNLRAFLQQLTYLLTHGITAMPVRAEFLQLYFQQVLKDSRFVEPSFFSLLSSLWHWVSPTPFLLFLSPVENGFNFSILTRLVCGRLIHNWLSIPKCREPCTGLRVHLALYMELSHCLLFMASLSSQLRYDELPWWAA